MTALSVVIAALDADRWLGEQLEALASQVTDFDWEVILADNGSRDGTKGVFEGYLVRLPSSAWVDASDTKGPAHARNVGAKFGLTDFALATRSLLIQQLSNLVA